MNQKNKEIKTSEGIFKKENYISFIVGVFILGGLLVVPLLWWLMAGIDYIALIIFSLMLCVSVLILYRRDGTTSWMRAVFSIIIAMIVASAVAAANEKLVFVSGTIIGFIVLILCGFIGIKLNKLFKMNMENNN